MWMYDSGAWDENLMHHSHKEAKQEYGANNVKLCTSPSDDENVITRIIRAYNHNMRK